MKKPPRCGAFLRPAAGSGLRSGGRRFGRRDRRRRRARLGRSGWRASCAGRPLPPATFSTHACNGLDTARDGSPFARKPATFARSRLRHACKRKTPKRKDESLGVRRCSTAVARVKRLRATEKPSWPTLEALRAMLRTLSLQGREGWTRRSRGWTRSTKPCVQRFGCCTQGLRDLGLQVQGLRVSGAPRCTRTRVSPLARGGRPPMGV